MTSHERRGKRTSSGRGLNQQNLVRPRAGWNMVMKQRRPRRAFSLSINFLNGPIPTPPMRPKSCSAADRAGQGMGHCSDEPSFGTKIKVEELRVAGQDILEQYGTLAHAWRKRKWRQGCGMGWERVPGEKNNRHICPPEREKREKKYFLSFFYSSDLCIQFFSKAGKENRKKCCAGGVCCPGQIPNQLSMYIRFG